MANKAQELPQRRGNVPVKTEVVEKKRRPVLTLVEPDPPEFAKVRGRVGKRKPSRAELAQKAKDEWDAAHPNCDESIPF